MGDVGRAEEAAIPMSGVVSYPEAVQIVLGEAKSVAGSVADQGSFTTESVPLGKAAGRVLAVTIHADRDQPPFPRSTRDGFACRSEDLAAGLRLKIIGQVRAGQHWEGFVGEGETVEIMTGAPVPEGADCVLMYEHAEAAGGWVRDTSDEGKTPTSGANVVAEGTEARRGDALLVSGTRLAAAAIGLAASVGVVDVQVFYKPSVAILATGDELVEDGGVPLAHQIRNSNSYALAALAAEAGGDPLRFPAAPDDRDRLKSAVEFARNSDLLVLSGGVSMGKYDLVEEVLRELGAEFFFTGVRIQPGKPVVFGRFPRAGSGAQYFFGLPGNPVSAMVTFRLFVEPLLGAMCGCPPALPRFCQARLSRQVKGKPGLTRFLPGRMESRLSGSEPVIVVEAAPVLWHGSGDLASTGQANCYIMVPADRNELAAGDQVTLLIG